MRSMTAIHTCKYLISAVFASCIAIVRAENPQPLSVTFGPDYIGFDGQWSPVSIRVGTPEQYLLVFPSTTSSETWLAGETFCTSTTCASQRGGIFYNASSTTWDEVGFYELGYSALSQSTEEGYYGFDNLAISDAVSSAGQIFALVDDYDHWIGHLGLGVQETRFQNTTNHLSFIATLVQNSSTIPTHSYSYTAGASYQGKGVQGSLTLGGVDNSRFANSNFWFTLADGYMPTVALQSISIAATTEPQNWASNPLQVMSRSEAAMFTIDSETPYLWLPESVCENIALALDLTWNSTLNLYLMPNATTSANLYDQNLQYTFTFADNATTSTTFDLKISSGAFNLELSYPFPGLFNDFTTDTVAYFPLRRANSTQQYTIGRAFLQETYLIVDYEQNAFSLSQALFPDSSLPKQLAAIARSRDSTWPGPAIASSGGLSTGAKAGIAVGAVAVVVAIVALMWFYCIRKRSDRRKSFGQTSQRTGLLSLFSKRSTVKSSSSTASASAAELTADRRHPSEMVSDSSNSRFELSTATAPVEMAGAEVAPNFFQERVNARIPQRNDPRSPIELLQPLSRSSVSKSDVGVQVREGSNSPAPAYSPTDITTRDSNSVSPYSHRQGSNPFQSGSDGIISPVTGTNSDRGLLGPVQNSRSDSGSGQQSSAISPLHAHGEQSSSNGSTLASNTQQEFARQPNTTANSLSPNPAGSGVRRSPSRDSRFREVLTEEDAPQFPNETAPQPDGQRSTPQSRFSWEK